MRIVFLNPLGEMGGAERSLLAWMKAVQEAYPSAPLHLLVPSDGLFARRARELGIDVGVVPIPEAVGQLGESALHGRRLVAGLRLAARMAAAGPGAARYILRLRAALRRLKPDLIHSNGIKTHLLVRLAAPSKTPVVWHIHDFIGHRPLMARAVAWASSSCKIAVAVSEAVAADARTLMPKLPIRVIYNVTDVDHFSPGPGDGDRLDAMAGLPQAEAGTVRIVLVATYAHWKGQDVFLEGAAKAVGSANTPPLRFYVVGGPIYKTAGSQFTQAQLRAQAQTLGLGSRVGFIGFQDDPAIIYRAADIVVHASTRPEPFGLTIIEAMACGRERWEFAQEVLPNCLLMERTHWEHLRQTPKHWPKLW